MKNKIFKMSVLAVSLSVAACKPGTKTAAEVAPESVTAADTVQSVALTYKPAENYFINNTVRETVPEKITTQEEFDMYFGKATTMAENGLPTPVDFSREFVIVADFGETARSVDMRPVSLEKAGDDLVFSYTAAEGEEAGFTSRPFLMVITDKQNEGNVKLQKQ